MSAPIMLTDEERDKFAAWLEQEARSDEGMIEQANKLGVTGEIMKKKLLPEMMAAKIIAAKLRATETMSY